jgi:hypothetical protein
MISFLIKKAPHEPRNACDSCIRFCTVDRATLRRARPDPHIKGRHRTISLASQEAKTATSILYVLLLHS